MRTITTTYGNAYRVRISPIPLIERTATGYRRRGWRVLLRQRLVVVSAPVVKRGDRMRVAQYAAEVADRFGTPQPVTTK